jgi:hypothetical protein
LPVNINQLHLAAQDQPRLIQLACELEAEARHVAKKAKLALEVARAMANKAARSSGVKMTESMVEADITLNPLVRKASEEALDAEKEADMASAIATAYEHRRAVLRIEADLFANDYWSAAGAAGAGMAGPTAAGRQQVEDKMAEIREKRRQQRLGEGHADV